MGKTIHLLKVSFWAGAIIDGIVAYLMLKTAVLGGTSSLTGYAPGIEYRFAIGVAASLMLGWTALLIWGGRKPMERKDILVLTVFPVISGIFIATVVTYKAGFMPLKGTVLICGSLSPLIILLSYSYWRATWKS